MRDTLPAENLIDQLYATALEPDEFLEEFSQSESGVTYTRLTSSFAPKVLELILDMAERDAIKVGRDPRKTLSNLIVHLQEVIARREKALNNRS